MDPLRSLQNRANAYTSWARTADRTARTEPARRQADARFAQTVREQFPHLSEAEVAIRAEHARKAYFTNLAIASAKARRARKGTGAGRHSAAVAGG